MDWKQIARTMAAEIENHADRLAARGASKVEIVPYDSYGTAERLQVRGRVLASPDVEPVNTGDSAWSALVASWRRFNSREIGGAGITARIAGVEATARTDDEGYFQFDLTVPALNTDVLWHPVELTLASPHRATGASGFVLVPSIHSVRGIISDIDDTVIETGATSLVTMARNTLLGTARTRTPFEGVARFYRDLTGNEVNPIFYVSSSPWNLHDLLSEFLSHNEIPRGPILLQDFGLSKDQWIHLPHQTHKKQQITAILDTYPHLPFVLIGDSGQKDPEIYLDIVRAHAGRIEAVYIRDVTTPQRDAEVHTIAAQCGEAGVPMVLVADTAAAEKDALARGLITKADIAAAAELPEIRPQG